MRPLIFNQLLRLFTADFSKINCASPVLLKGGYRLLRLPSPAGKYMQIPFFCATKFVMLNGDNKRCFSAEENILDQALWFVDNHNIKSQDKKKD